jgi:heme/copper-type cytochrome/quinol oxidase subunit 2
MKAWSDKMNGNAFALSLLAILFMVSLLPSFPTEVASAAGTVRDFYVATEYDLGGPGYSVFYPQTLVVEQGDQVNITVRNVGTESFTLNIEGQNSVVIQPGSQNTSGIQPADTDVPVFTASTPGIFGFSADKFPEMNGQIVVLPTDQSGYNPSTQTRSFTQLVLPDFAGDGYDKFFPGVMIVNQGDTVNVSIRNTDDVPHGFAIAPYKIDVAVNPGQDQPNGSIAPLTTSVQPFTASDAGVFRWLCTTPCGPGHFEMVGQLVVLPTQGRPYTPDVLTMYSYLTVVPDFGGEGYDKYVPGNIFVNEGDLVYIKVRNTDEHAHGFALPNFGINNETIAGAQNTTSELVPMDTYITAFFADQPGVYEFFCTIYCGPGHDEMIGYLTVLPTQNATSVPSQPGSGNAPPFLFLLLSFALLVIGILIGVIIVAKFGREKTKT